ncbi:MAG: BCCT family transporter [bacterium]|nr:BCCT family transporter [Gammaproteobacteria bacterium]HIL94877.1 BCCT family transporter [Pseudomonadales bacterium]
MSMVELEIVKSEGGFYDGFNKIVTIGSKLVVSALVIWAAFFSEQAAVVLGDIKNWSFASFGPWYIYVSAFYLFVCLILAIYPKTGSVRLGKEQELPEFSRFSWVSMMFGAGIGIGMLTFATAEPISHFVSNPDTIRGLTESKTQSNVISAFKWSFLHWGFVAWGCYSLCGMALAFFSYKYDLPLTIRSSLAPLFGRYLEGGLGHVIDITAVIATILGVAVSIGLGVSQFAAGVFEVSGMSWLVNESGTPSTAGMLAALAIIMSASTLSAISGVGKGIKWLSNLNMVLSFAMLAFFLIFGASTVALHSLAFGLWEYVITLPVTVLTYWAPDSTEPAASLYQWQSLSWTVFYWAWWIAFAPFVGLFLARISRGRTIREYVIGALIVPSLLCFVWFTFVGGTAIELELNGAAGGSIISTSQESQLFATLKLILSGLPLTVMFVMVVVLLLTYLVTTADSAVLVINTINSGGDESQKGRFHIIIWGVALTLVISMLLLAGGMEAIRASMFVAALPFSLIMALMALSLIKVLIVDPLRTGTKE